MLADFQGPRSETLRQSEDSTSALAVVRHHPGDPAELVSHPESETVVALIGRLDESSPTETGAVTRLGRALADGDAAALRDLSGSFGAAVRGTNPEVIWVVSDRWGLYPIYYSAMNGLLAFSSKLSPLLRNRLLDWSLDSRALLDLFTYEHVTGDRTLANEVRLLPAGSVLRFADGQLHLQSYASFPALPGESEPASLDEVAAALHGELGRSVEKAGRHSDRVAITLSGGLDSRALLGCAVERGVPVRTYTFGDPRSVEVGVARELARRAGVPQRCGRSRAAFSSSGSITASRSPAAWSAAHSFTSCRWRSCCRKKPTSSSMASGETRCWVPT